MVSRAGKYWNVGLSEPGRLPATSKQLRALYMLSGRKEDFRGRGLTRDEASDLIEKMGEELDARKLEKQVTPMKEKMFEAYIKKAKMAANAAGSRWLEKNSTTTSVVVTDETSGEAIEVKGVIGLAWIPAPSKRSAFGKWLSENGYISDENTIDVGHDYKDRWELELLIACERAALMSLAQSGIGDLKLMAAYDPHVDFLE